MVSERIRPAAFVVALLIAGAPCHSQDRANLALTILSVPLIAAGQGLYWNSLLGGDGAESLTGISADREAGVWAGVGISWLGAGMFGASRWSALRAAPDVPAYKLFSAPFSAEILGDERVFAPVAVAAAARIAAMKDGIWQDYFAVDRRYFLGYEWDPSAALAARTATAALVALGSAVASESLLRGIVLEKFGFASSVASEGAIVVVPYLVFGPRRSDAETWYGRSDPALMTAEMLFAAYSGLLASSSGDPRRSVALRFWLETVLSTLSYVEAIVADPDGPTEGLGFGLRLSY